MCLKINWSVKTPWHRPSVGVACSLSWAPDRGQFSFSTNCLIFSRASHQLPTLTLASLRTIIEWKQFLSKVSNGLVRLVILIGCFCKTSIWQKMVIRLSLIHPCHCAQSSGQQSVNWNRGNKAVSTGIRTLFYLDSSEHSLLHIRL